MDWMENCTIKIARFEHYPQDDPTSYCIGFTVTCNSNGKSVYRDTLIPITSVEGSKDEDIANLAWGILKDGIGAWYASVCKKSTLVGQTFLPA